MTGELKLSTSPIILRTESNSGKREAFILVRLEANQESGTTPKPNEELFPADLCVVVDCSWWMEEDKLIESKDNKPQFRSKLDLVRSALAQTFGELAQNNTLSLIAFSETATVNIKRVGPNQADLYMSAIRSIQTKSGCHLAEGLREAGRLLKSRPDNRIGKILVLTGGKIENRRGALLVADELANESIGIDAIGIGEDASLLYLQQLVSQGGGSAELVHNSGELRRVLSNFLAASQRVYASEIRALVIPPADWKVRYCVRVTQDFLDLPVVASSDKRSWAVRLAGVSSRQPADLFLFLHHAPETNVQSEETFSLALEYSLPDGTKHSEQQVISDLKDRDVENGEPTFIALLNEFKKAEIKCLENDQEEASRQGNHNAAEAIMGEITARLAQLNLETGKKMAAEALSLYREKRAIPNKLLNDLMQYTARMSLNRVTLDAANQTPNFLDTRAESAKSTTVKQGQDATAEVVFEQLLALCRSAIIKRESLVEMVKQEAQKLEMSRQTRIKPSEPDFCLATDRWLREILDAGPEWLDEQVELLENFHKAIQEWEYLERQLVGCDAQQDRRLTLLHQVFDTILFYGWDDLGWLSTRDSLRNRRELLEQASLQENNNGVF